MIVLHNLLIAALRQQTPLGESPASVLTEVLSIGQEAARRRLRGDIQLTLDEAVTLAKRLGVSLDNMIEGSSADKYAFHITPFRVSPSMDEYYYTLIGVLSAYDFVKSDSACCSYIVGRVLSPTFYFKYDAFTRFTMLKWIYQVQDSTKYSCFSTVKLSPEFERVYQPFCEAAMQVPTTYVFNELLFTSVVQDLGYFYDIKLLTRKEVETLKREVLLLIDDFEEVATRGCYPNGVPVAIYLSDLYVDISYHYVSGNHFDSCAIGVYGLNFLSCQDGRIVADHKAWIESLIKHSTLISRSGEGQRTAFFNRQREKVHALHR